MAVAGKVHGDDRNVHARFPRIRRLFAACVLVAAGCSEPAPTATSAATADTDDARRVGDSRVQDGVDGAATAFTDATHTVTDDAAGDTVGRTATDTGNATGKDTFHDAANDAANDVVNDTADTPTDTEQPKPACPEAITKLTFDKHTTTATLDHDINGLRTYTLHSTAKLLDGPKDGKRTVQEHTGYPRLRSCNRVLDALYALAIEEVIENSVDQLTDAAFNNGKPVPCKCFATGAKWPWAWTRDSAYAIDLGLALIDLERSRNTLMFKVSEPKQGVKGGAQVVQDTGTGGGWPVSTDRVAWLRGALALHKVMRTAEQTAFRKIIEPIIAETVGRNLDVAYDPVLGLVRGETSFLDWREQTYPLWMQDNPVAIASSMSTSTNYLHTVFSPFDAAKVAKKLLPDGFGGTVLGKSPASFAVSILDPGMSAQRDLLSTALRMNGGSTFATFAEPADAMSSYPITPFGPPVIAPQQQHAAIYHNRAQWPFVTAYALRAATNQQFFGAQARYFDAIVRGAAVQLSNMENFDASTGEPWTDDGQLSGPVVNSRRQLWSVAAFLSAIHDAVFHIGPGHWSDGFNPQFSVELAQRYFPGAHRIALLGVHYRDVTFDYSMNLPDTSAAGPLKYVQPGDGSQSLLNGKAVGQVVDDSALESLAGKHVSWERTAMAISKSGHPGKGVTVKGVNAGIDEAWFAPRAPTITAVTENNSVVSVAWKGTGEAGVTYEVARDGVVVAAGLSATTWTDDSKDHATKAHCYSVSAQFTSSGNTSHRSAPKCFWGHGDWRVQELGAHRIGGPEVTVKGTNWASTWSTAHGKPHWHDYGRWIGAPAQETAVVSAFTPRATGEHLLQLIYANKSGPINTGITCANKRVRVLHAATGAPVGMTKEHPGYAVMPHLGSVHRWGESTIVRLGTLTAATPYRIVIDEDGGVMNMSYLQHYKVYTGGAGGGDETYNRVDLAAVRILTKTGTQTPAVKPALAFDGNNDLDKIPKALWRDPGAKAAPWHKFAVTWNASHMQVASVSQAFENEARALLLYLTPDDSAYDKPADGITYLGVAGKLPFTPRWAVAMRGKSDLGDGFGPWNGVYRREADGTWILQRRFVVDAKWGVMDAWSASDKHTLSCTVDRGELYEVFGQKNQRLRIAGHVVQGGGTPFADTIPADHTPATSPSVGFAIIDLGAAATANNWLVK